MTGEGQRAGPPFPEPDDFVEGYLGEEVTPRGASPVHAMDDPIAPLNPAEWLAPSATGAPEQCVAAVRNQFSLGCDGVIMHGASPTELEPIVNTYVA